MVRSLIIGAGVVGACLAHALARRGHEVMVIDAAQPAQGATAATFGWINASYALSPAHFALRRAAIDAHRRLAHDLGLDLWDWPGCLWFDEIDKAEAQLAPLGYPLHRLSPAEVRAREPLMPARPALLLPEEGAVEAAALTRAALAASGARLYLGLKVSALGPGRAETPAGPILADHIILANGTGAAELAGLPMLRRPGLMLVSRPLPRLIQHILALPGQDLRQDRQGRLLAPLAAHHQAEDAEKITALPIAEAEATLSALLRCEVRAESVTLAERPVPEDGLPAVGALAPGLWIAVMHSGVTLAPIVAEGLAAEIAGQTAPLLAPFTPARFNAPAA
jgi:glycine/D-amino acid oxidase-like deaminating enzyme